MSAPPSNAGSAWSPFRQRAFAVIWTAGLVSSTGGWMFNVGAGWLMTSLSPSPLAVSLVQTATLLPVVLFALPAGALADIFDRRRFLLVTQWALVLVSALAALLVALGAMTPKLLLLFTFLIGIATAFMAPAWQAIVPQLVPRADLRSAIALNGVGINLARAIGPALAGVLITALGIRWPFMLNALSILPVIAALLWWRPPAAPPRPLPAEQVWMAMRTGLRYARENRALKATLGRALGFFPFATAYWALLPLIAREQLQGGPGLYGALLGSIGVGAVLGAFALPWFRARLSTDRFVLFGELGTALAMLVFGSTASFAPAAVAGLLAGLAWILMMSSFSTSAQLALPEWVRARGLAVFQIVFMGAMAGGSALWGHVVEWLGLGDTLRVAAAALLVAIPLSWRAKLNQGEHVDYSSSRHWPEPQIALPVTHDRGPVLVTIVYCVPTPAWPLFTKLMQELGSSRRRDGASAWGLFQDAAQPTRFQEVFLVESWLEHLRQHERVTGAEQLLQEQIDALLMEDTRIDVTHWLGGRPEIQPREESPQADRKPAGG